MGGEDTVPSTAGEVDNCLYDRVYRNPEEDKGSIADVAGAVHCWSSRH